MSDYAVVQLSDPAEAPAIGALLARALDPSYASDIPDADLRRRYCTTLYTANTRWSFDRGRVNAVRTPDGVCAGALSLIPHPTPPWTDEDDARYGYDLLTEFGDLGADFGNEEDDAREPLEARRDAWTYINVLGVEPALQGNGIGSALMAHALTDADRAGLPMGLITDTGRNVRFYERLGFATIRESPPNAPIHLTTMLREPLGRGKRQ